MSAARDSTQIVLDAVGAKPMLDLPAHLPLRVVLLLPVDQIGERRDRLVDQRGQIAIGGVVGGGPVLHLSRTLLLQQAVDGEPARVELHFPRLALLALQVFAEVVEHRLGVVMPHGVLFRGRYMDTSEEEERIDVAEAVRKLRELERERTAAEATMNRGKSFICSSGI